MTHLSFPYLSGNLINLLELPMDDAKTIVNIKDHEIANYLYEVSHPYWIERWVKDF